MDSVYLLWRRCSERVVYISDEEMAQKLVEMGVYDEYEKIKLSNYEDIKKAVFKHYVIWHEDEAEEKVGSVENSIIRKKLISRELKKMIEKDSEGLITFKGEDE